MINFKLINPDKCYLILSGKENEGTNVGNNHIENW